MGADQADGPAQAADSTDTFAHMVAIVKGGPDVLYPGDARSGAMVVVEAD